MRRDIQLYCTLDDVEAVSHFLKHSNALKNLPDSAWLNDIDEALDALFLINSEPFFSDTQSRQTISMINPDTINQWARTHLTRDGWKQIKRAFARYKYNQKNRIFKIDIKDDTRLQVIAEKDRLGFNSYDETLQYILQLNHELQQHTPSVDTPQSKLPTRPPEASISNESNLITIQRFDPNDDEENSAFVTDEQLVHHVISRLPAHYRHAFQTALKNLFCEGYLQAKGDKQRSVRKMQEHLETNDYLKQVAAEE